MRRDAKLARLLACASAWPELGERAQAAVRGRVVAGPMLDAFACAPLLGQGNRLELPENKGVRARLEILIWEAGACALQVPELGKWVWGSQTTFDALVGNPARGSLRGRVLASRCLEICVRGIPTTADSPFLGTHASGTPALDSAPRAPGVDLGRAGPRAPHRCVRAIGGNVSSTGCVRNRPCCAAGPSRHSLACPASAFDSWVPSSPQSSTPLMPSPLYSPPWPREPPICSKSVGICGTVSRRGCSRATGGSVAARWPGSRAGNPLEARHSFGGNRSADAPVARNGPPRPDPFPR